MAARVNRCAAFFGCLLLLGINAAHSQEVTPPAYLAAAHSKGVPPNVLFAIALQESGTNLRGKLIPWPWTLGIAGNPQRYSTRAAACAALRLALSDIPATRIDVGLGQINVGYHGHRVEHPCALLDPYRNLGIASTILSENHAPGEDWLLAVGRYHRPAGGEIAARYRDRVQRHLARIAGTHVATTSASAPAP